MAITRFKKIILASYAAEEKKVLHKIHSLGLVEIISLNKNSPAPHANAIEDKPDFDLALKELRDSIDFLKGFEDKKSILSQLTQKKPFLDFEKIPEVINKFDYAAFCRQISAIERAGKELDSRKESLLKTKADIRQWINLAVPFEDIGHTEYTAGHIGRLKKDKFLSFPEALFAETKCSVIEKVEESSGSVFVYVVYLRAEEERVSGLLKKYGFDYMYFPGLNGTAREMSDNIAVELASIEIKKREFFQEARLLLDEKEKLGVLYDYFNNLKLRKTASADFMYTKEAFLLEGWIRDKDITKMKNELSGVTDKIDIFIEEPSAGDKVPVELENKGIVQPFEFITRIYGMPAAGELDPTPFLAPFFFLFFGLCLSDAGYGFIISLSSLFVLKRFKMGPQGTRFFKLFFYCGLSTIVIGALTGSWFGNIIDIMAQTGSAPLIALRDLKNKMIVLDPQKDPMKLLIIALFLGIVQIWTGYVIAIYGNIRNRRFMNALLDQGSMLIFLAGFTGVILSFLGAIEKTASPIFIKILIFGSVAIVLTQGRANPGVGSKLFFGVYSLYSAFSGYISDVLSYSRLWALGLVTGVMAYTCNLMAVVIGGLVPYVGILFSAIILLAGHLITLVMNLLGAFVHPVRLQFVEFFSKFFIMGGKPFKPLKLENRYTTVENNSQI